MTRRTTSLGSLLILAIGVGLLIMAAIAVLRSIH